MPEFVFLISLLIRCKINITFELKTQKMIKKRLIRFLLVFIIFGIRTGYSQTFANFSSDSLISELKIFYNTNNVDLSKDKDAFFKDSVIMELDKIWLSEITRENRKSISNILNYQNEKRFDKNTTGLNFIRSLIFLKNSKESDYLQWLTGIEIMINNHNVQSQTVQNYIDNLFNFLYHNILCNTKSADWVLSSGTYALQYNNSLMKPVISINSGTLELHSPDNDTVSIYNATGYYIITESVWKGKTGKITWERYQIPPSEIKAELKNYSLNLRKQDFTIDSVTFTNKKVLDYPVLGQLSHKALLRTFKEGIYPQFRSYRTDYNLKSSQKNIEFVGGIQMKGKTLYYSGTDSIPAIAEYKIKGKVVLKAMSENFSSFENKLKSYETSIILFVGKKDSISHPNVELSIDGNTISMIRNLQGTGNRPFYNSYQKIFFTSDRIFWNTQDSVIMFLSKTGNDAYFKSVDYFTKEDFEKHKMYEMTNPLFQLRNYTQKYNTLEFYASDYAKFVKQAVEGVEQRLIGFWYDGFIEYNTSTKLVRVNQKLFDYIKYFFDKKDYDVINIESKGVTVNSDAVELFPVLNAGLDTRTSKLYVYGVNQVVINERKKTGFIPDNQSFIIERNRNMQFSGRLRVGLADFYGKQFYFDYEKYSFTVTNSDSLVYRVWEKDMNELGETDRAKYLNSAIEHLSGKIQIDLNSNKSGAKDIPVYPSFTATDTSYVYYDRRNKQGSVYPRETFYFQNYPFKHDSLMNINKKKLQIPGMMFSGGIFPKFEDTLKVQKDYSLGFLHQTADEGIKLFEGKVSLSSENSTMHSFIRLSNEGLQANGIAKWNNTTIATRDFNLYPDSLTALADEIEIKDYVNESEHADFPQVTGKLVQTKWDAENDYVLYKTTGIPVDMYGGKAKFSGTFEYRPNSLIGKGKAIVDEGTLYADNFNFVNSSFFTEKADIEIKEEHSNTKDVIIKNMKSFVDINSGKAVFQALINNDKSSVTFVTDEYISYPNHLVWHTGEGKINMNYNMDAFTNPKLSKEEILIDSTYLMDVCKFDKSIYSPGYGDLKFISTKKNQDSLMFFGSRANYFTGNKKLIAKDVQRIIVADITVTPSGDIVIGDNGEMEKLLNTTVKARGLHLITNVDIKINSSNSYIASSGIYQYEDMNNSFQNINFDNITYDQNKKATVAHGFVEQYHKFTLNPWFDFYGDVYFNATKDLLKFSGFAKLKHNCSVNPKWFHFISDINPDSVYIPLEPLLHSDLESNTARIYADIMISKDSVHTFPSILSNDPFGTSESIISLRDSTYYVTYNPNENRFEITTLKKFKNKELPGNYMDLSRSYCIANAEGKLNYGKSIKINKSGGTGNIRFDLNSGEVTMQTLSYFDFFFNKKSLDIIIDRLNLNTDLSALRVNDKSYNKLMSELMGIEKLNTMLNEMSENAGIPKKFPAELNNTFVFTNLYFKWDQISESFKSFGKIGISNIGETMINKQVNGYIQIKKRRTGDIIYLYLETATNEWFFFSFSGGILRTFSSVSEYNNAIEELKTKDKKIKTENGIFNYMLTNEESKNLFIYEFTGNHPALNDFDENEDIENN